MRILHTSDWHLGVSLEQAPRDEEHQRFLSWLLDTIEDEAIDVLLVAGDVFHHSQPSARAQADYYGFLTRCARQPSLRKVVIVGGNHDSASRLDAPKEILDALDVHVVGGVLAEQTSWERCLCPIYKPGSAREVEAVVVAVPYVHEARLGIVTTQFSESEIGARYAEGFERLYTHLADLAIARFGDVALIATGHLTCTAWDQPVNRADYNSEIHQVGSIGALPITIFDERYSYVALGHIHQCRQVGSGPIWYAGTPVATKIDESESPRQVLIVELDAANAVNVHVLAEVTQLEVPVWREIIVLAAPHDEIVASLKALSSEAELAPYIYIYVVAPGKVYVNAAIFETLLDERFEPARRPRIVDTKQRSVATAARVRLVETRSHAALSTRTPEEVFCMLYALRHDHAPDETTLSAFRTLLSATDDAAERAELEAVLGERS
ncbi:MAG: exonuclease subunit SbcD [Bradymonadaceae bacterium]|nr:exonuclease subunit SbcD [Lujinxingiaceae bacterium]